MVPDNQALDEVVVVGYGAMKRSDLTGSVASVAAKDIEGFQTSSVAGALGGQIAGVQITSTDGTPGAGFNINIRGVGSLTGDSSPLYIVDGFQVDVLIIYQILILNLLRCSKTLHLPPSMVHVQLMEL